MVDHHKKQMELYIQCLREQPQLKSWTGHVVGDHSLCASCNREIVLFRIDVEDEPNYDYERGPNGTGEIVMRGWKKFNRGVWQHMDREIFCDSTHSTGAHPRCFKAHETKEHDEMIEIMEPDLWEEELKELDPNDDRFDDKELDPSKWYYRNALGKLVPL
jgi:hypothetical protein